MTPGQAGKLDAGIPSTIRQVAWRFRDDQDIGIVFTQRLLGCDWTRDSETSRAQNPEKACRELRGFNPPGGHPVRTRTLDKIAFRKAFWQNQLFNTPRPYPARQTLGHSIDPVPAARDHQWTARSRGQCAAYRA